MPESPQTVFRLTLTSCPDSVPVEIRLRRLLKIMKRAYGLRCLKVEEVMPPKPEEVQTHDG